MRKPPTVLFLDVDGTLLPYPCRSTDWAWEDVDDLRVSRQLADAVASLGCRRVWLTSWGEAANDVLCPLFGWEPLEVLDWADKAEAVRAYGADRLIWADDDIDSWLHGPLPGEHLLIRTRMDTGLTRRDLDLMREFVAVGEHS